MKSAKNLAVTAQTAFLPASDLALERASAEAYGRAARAPGTQDVYGRVWAGFCTWARARGVPALPAAAEDVAAYLAAEADRGQSVSSIQLKAAAIAAAHDMADLTSPTGDRLVRKTLAGIRRVRAATPRKKAALTAAGGLAATIGLIGDDLAGVRDRALLLLGFAGALRRSELAALEVEDISPRDAGLLITIRQSKGDQEAKGQAIAIVPGTQLCPIQALKRWLERANIIEGPLFRRVRRGGLLGDEALTGHSVARIVKVRAAAAGLDPELFSGHSLRAGFLTSAAENRATIWKMAEVSRHKSIDTLREYVRIVELFDQHAAQGLL